MLKEFLNRVYVLGTSSRIRTSCLIAALATIFPSFYGAWCLVNYFNDFFYGGMFRAQIFFLVTEIFVTYLLYRNMDTSLPVDLSSMYYAGFICLLHVVLAVREKVLWGLIWPGASNVGRDLLLVGSDFVVIVVAVIHTQLSTRFPSLSGRGDAQHAYRPLSPSDGFSSVQTQLWFRPAILASALFVFYSLFLRFE